MCVYVMILCFRHRSGMGGRFVNLLDVPCAYIKNGVHQGCNLQTGELKFLNIHITNCEVKLLRIMRQVWNL